MKNIPSWIVTIGVVCVLAVPGGTVHGQGTLFIERGDSDNAFFGGSVSGAGDVNGDGYADVIVGALHDDNNGPSSGSARVFSGRDGSVLYTFNGDSADDRFGRSVGGAGDVNADGYADLIIGAPGDDSNGIDSGSARVFSGRDGSILYTFNGDSANDSFGYAVSAAGDVNADGIPDLIVGARLDDNHGSNSGSARVFSGHDGSILYTFNGDSAGDFFGRAVSGAGDVNADGFADLIVGAHGDDPHGFGSGSARVFSGREGSILYTFDGDAAEDVFGAAVSGAGDVNADGHDDLIVGAQWADNNGTNSGSAQVFSGSNGSILYTFVGGAGDNLGWSVSDAGDVNADGFADVIVGAVGPAIALVFSGLDGSLLFTLEGEGGSFGVSVSGAGDVNADGFADLIVGAPGIDSNHNSSGSAWVISPRGPDDLVIELIASVVLLNLQQGITNGLDGKLDAALHALQDVNENNDGAAIHTLEAFINAVQNQSGNHIPVADADALIADGQEIIALLLNE